MTELPGARVGIVTPSLLTHGGTEVYLQQLARVQRGLGLAVQYFTQDAPGSVTEFEGFPVEACGDLLSEAMSPVSWFQRASGVAKLATRIAASADWVELHRLAPLDLMRALHGRVRQLLFVHTPELTCPALGRYLARSGRCCDRAPGSGCLGVNAFENCMSTADGTPFPAKQRLRAFTRGPASRMAAALADGCVFNSAAMARLFAHTIGSPRRSLVLNPPLFVPVADTARKTNRLLYVGSLHDAKGCADAVHAASSISGSELHTHGDGVSRGELKELARQCGANVLFHGWSKPESLARAYAEAACLLVPSRLFEAWGMVGPEAIAQGCPVAAYDVGGIREWLDPQFGEVVPAGNVAALAAAARRQLDRHQAGLDTSTWRAQAEARWGMSTFARAYASAVRALSSPPALSSVGHLPASRPATSTRRVVASAVQTLERARTAVAGLAQALLFRPPGLSASRILVYRIGTIGDHACAMPALSAIRARYPQAEITLACEARDTEPWPSRLGFDRELGFKIEPYATAAELKSLVHKVDPETLYYLAPQPLTLRRALRDALFFRSAGVGAAVGFTAVDPPAWSAQAMQPWHVSSPAALRLLEACRLQPAAPTKPKPHPQGIAAGCVAFAPAGKTPVQRWPEARYLELARMAQADGYVPVWLGDEHDAVRMAEAGELPGLNLMGQLSPEQLADTLSDTLAVVSNDTGIAHLAALRGAPLLEIASARENVGAWDPWGTAPVTVLRRAMTCEGCRLTECADTACMLWISVEEAWIALRKLLAQKKSGIHGAGPANMAANAESPSFLPVSKPAARNSAGE
ncbi:MAG: glycosyltransferase [Planctomycetes bacterium]|nr:glycosyltransferase [Planctomycetota bacterium]